MSQTINLQYMQLALKLMTLKVGEERSDLFKSGIQSALDFSSQRPPQVHCRVLSTTNFNLDFNLNLYQCRHQKYCLLKFHVLQTFMTFG